MRRWSLRQRAQFWLSMPEWMRIFTFLALEKTACRLKLVL
jgi:hypothetical protein